VKLSITFDRLCLRADFGDFSDRSD
jgi:hypothetical protein